MLVASGATLLTISQPSATAAESAESTQIRSPSPEVQVRAGLPQSLIKGLRAVVGEENIDLDPDNRATHGKPWSSYHRIDAIPDCVVFPASTEEVSEVVKLCAAYGVPLVPYGGATSLEGHTLTVAGGVSLDLCRLNAVVRVSGEDLDATVEAGLGYLDLNEHLAPMGLFFPLDPGPGASIGGMCACRCSGSTAVKYGTMRDNVLAVTAVLADGTIIRTGTRARKSAAGYDLTRLLIGSEGTLGVITEVTVRLRRKPEHFAAVRVCFPSVREAAAAANATLLAGVEVGRCELMDDKMVKIVNDANGYKVRAVLSSSSSRLPLAEPPLAPHGQDEEATTLLYELVGASDASVKEQVARVQAVVRANGGYDLRVSSDPAEATQMWRARKEALWSASAQYPDCEPLITGELPLA
jgi:D-lactate dehydrogenase (cytochrome)